METVRIYRLDHLPRVLAARLRDDLQKATKGRFALLVNALRSMMTL